MSKRMIGLMRLDSVLFEVIGDLLKQGLCGRLWGHQGDAPRVHVFHLNSGVQYSNGATLHVWTLNL